MSKTVNLAETSKRSTKVQEKVKDETRRALPTRQLAVQPTTVDKTKRLPPQTTNNRPNLPTMPNSTPTQQKEPIGDHGKVKKVPDIACECQTASGTGGAPPICPLHTPVTASSDKSSQENKEVGCIPKSIKSDNVSEQRNSAGGTKLQLNVSLTPDDKNCANECNTSFSKVAIPSSIASCSTYGSDEEVYISEIPLIEITSGENNITVNISNSGQQNAVSKIDSSANAVRNIYITTSSSNVIVSIDPGSDSQSSSSITD